MSVCICYACAMYNVWCPVYVCECVLWGICVMCTYIYEVCVSSVVCALYVCTCAMWSVLRRCGVCRQGEGTCGTAGEMSEP